jgi:hypothetical protein
MWYSERTVLLRTCGVGGGCCGDDALAYLFGDGDHEVMDLLEVEVCHLEAVGVLKKGGAENAAMVWQSC